MDAHGANLVTMRDTCEIHALSRFGNTHHPKRFVLMDAVTEYRWCYMRGNGARNEEQRAPWPIGGED